MGIGNTFLTHGMRDAVRSASRGRQLNIANRVIEDLNIRGLDSVPARHRGHHFSRHGSGFGRIFPRSGGRGLVPRPRRAAAQRAHHPTDYHADWCCPAAATLFIALGPLTVLSGLTLSAIIGLVVALALQTTIANLIAGAILLQDRLLGSTTGFRLAR